MNEEKKTQGRRTFEVREETIFDYLMHAATREDIANLRLEVKDDIAKLDTKIDRIAGQLDTKIDKLRQETKEDFKELTKKVDIQFRWMMGILLIGIIAPFAAKFFT